MKRRVSIGLLVLLALGAVLVVARYRYLYPYGVRTCFLPCLMASLSAYAADHEGKYPEAEEGFVGLAKLYPTYVSGRGDLLAGLSGDRETVARKLAAGEKLTSNECSWIYLPGRTQHSGKVVILYERSSGVAGNGGRLAGRAVGFADGSMEQVPDEILPRLVEEQALDPKAR